MDDNKNISKTNQSYSIENSSITNAIHSVIFHNDNVSFFIFKKTERIVSALYIISEFLSDMEPAKFAIKDIANSLLRDALNLSNRSSNSDQFSTILLRHFVSVSFLLNLIRNTGRISNMNADILLEEINKISEILLKVTSKSGSQSKIFNSDFFATNAEIKESDFGSYSFVKNTTASRNTFDSVNDNQKDIKDIMKDSVLYNNTQKKDAENRNPVKDKNNRQEVIITMLKKNKLLTIKDFSLRIRDCSEKTIQRELITLMAKGVLKKEGERRWSKYSLA